MKKIVLFCSAGMSTSLLATKMQKSAKDKGIEVSIETLPEAQMEKRIDDDVDVVLLGPQIRYALRRAKKLCDEKKNSRGCNKLRRLWNGRRRKSTGKGYKNDEKINIRRISYE